MKTVLIFLGLCIAFAFGWFLSAAMRGGKEQEEIMDDHRARNN